MKSQPVTEKQIEKICNLANRLNVPIQDVCRRFNTNFDKMDNYKANHIINWLLAQLKLPNWSLTGSQDSNQDA